MKNIFTSIVREHALLFIVGILTLSIPSLLQSQMQGSSPGMSSKRAYTPAFLTGKKSSGRASQPVVVTPTDIDIRATKDLTVGGDIPSLVPILPLIESEDTIPPSPPKISFIGSPDILRTSREKLDRIARFGLPITLKTFQSAFESDEEIVVAGMHNLNTLTIRNGRFKGLPSEMATLAGLSDTTAILNLTGNVTFGGDVVLENLTLNVKGSLTLEDNVRFIGGVIAAQGPVFFRGSSHSVEVENSELTCRDAPGYRFDFDRIPGDGPMQSRYIVERDHAEFRNNRIHDCDIGLLVLYGGDLEATENTIYNTHIGIDLTDRSAGHDEDAPPPSGEIWGNTFHDTHIGIEVHSGTAYINENAFTPGSRISIALLNISPQARPPNFVNAMSNSWLRPATPVVNTTVDTIERIPNRQLESIIRDRRNPSNIFNLGPSGATLENGRIPRTISEFDIIAEMASGNCHLVPER